MWSQPVHPVPTVSAMRSVLLSTGDADVMVAGGTEASVCPTGIAGFTALTALSTTNDPQHASRPFDKDRDGFVLGRRFRDRCAGGTGTREGKRREDIR